MPVYSDPESDYTALRLGHRIRDRRKRRGWTLTDLASRVSVSVGTLSAIENHRVAIKVDLFLAVAEALGVPIDALLPPPPTRHFYIARRGPTATEPSRPIRFVNPNSERVVSYHNRLWPLAQEFVGKHIEPFELDIQPVDDENIHFISHNSEEFFFVLRGKLECLIKTPDGLTSETLGPGDCMYFWSYLPHAIRSVDEEPARSIHVVYSPHELAESEARNGKAGPTVYLIDTSCENLAQRIGGKLIALRQARGMSSVEFSGQVGISVRRLAQIERGQSPISMQLLLHICRTFSKSREYFLGGTHIQRPFSRVFRASEIRRLRQRRVKERIETGCIASASCNALAEAFPNRGMHPHLVSISQTRDRDHRLAAHPGQEFVYVLKGAVGLVTMHEETRLEETLLPGDSCFLDASVPHQFFDANLSPYEKTGAEMIRVEWNPGEAQRALEARRLAPHSSSADVVSRASPRRLRGPATKTLGSRGKRLALPTGR